MAHRPYGSAQTGMHPFALCCTDSLPSDFLCQRAWNFNAEPLEQGKGEKLASQVLDRQHLKARHDAVDQLRFQPKPHIFIGIQVCLSLIHISIYNLLKKKEFRWIQLDGGKYRISKKSFDDWLDNLEQ